MKILMTILALGLFGSLSACAGTDRKDDWKQEVFKPAGGE